MMLIRHKQTLTGRRGGADKATRVRPVRAVAERVVPSVKAETTETDIIVIGSGIGGLSCAALLAKYGNKVTVCESHYIPGGAAHAFVKDGYHFEAGPSLYSGMSAKGKEANPLGHVFQAIGEELDLIRYNQWNVIVPEGTFLTKIGNDNFYEVLEKIRGPEAVRQWAKLQEIMRPLAKASTMMPPAALRADPGVLITGFGRYFSSIIQAGPAALQLTGPFSKVIEKDITDPFVRNWLDLLSFLLSGLPANGTIAAEIAFMFNEWYRPDCYLEYPRGGSMTMINALIRGLEKFGGEIKLSTHVNEIMVENGRAVGVKLRGGRIIRARKAVVTNASMWDTVKLLPAGALPASYTKNTEDTPKCPSFMHLHLGFDATGLPADLQLHHIIVNTWEGGVDTPQNVVLISIASIIDPGLAPAGKHVLHAYTPATEPFEVWEGLKPNTPEYEAMKEKRSQVLWKAVEKIIPDIRARAEITMVGTPLTHAKYLRRSKGTYGPAIKAGEAMFPGPLTPIPGLYAVGDSTFPGIGLPAVAASGHICANTLTDISTHIKMLEEISL